MDWGDFIAAGAGALLGALAAFLLGLLVERRKERAEDRARVTNFLLDMATRRGFYAAEGSTWATQEDAIRLEAAVQSLRRASRDVRTQLHRPARAATDALVAITRSCNMYLETVERSDFGGQDLEPLHQLLEEIGRSAEGLHRAVDPSTRSFAKPGSLAYPLEKRG